MDLRFPPWVLSLKRPLQLGLVAACVAASFALLVPNYYKSEGCVLPLDVKGMGGGMGNLAAAAAAFGVSVPGGDGSDANFVDILNSRTLRERLLETEFAFKDRTWRFGPERALNQSLREYLGGANRDQNILLLKGVLTASRDLKSKVITITAETRSPELSQQIVSRTLGLLEAFVQEKGRTRGGAKVVFAEERLREARQEMAQSENEFRRFLDVNRNYQVSTDPNIRIMGMRLESEFKLRQQLVTNLAIGREQALMEEKNDIPILNVLDSGNLPFNKSRPNRFQIIQIAFFLGAISAWIVSNRVVISKMLFSVRNE